MDIRDIKDIIEIIGRTNISRFEMQKGDTNLIIEKYNDRQAKTENESLHGNRAEAESVSPHNPGIVQAVVSNDEPKNMDEELYIVKSPIIGTYYSAPSPDVQPFIEAGSKVKAGDILCIIEAMKAMNEIVSEYEGEVVEVFASNGQIVEYGQPLVSIRR